MSDRDQCQNIVVVGAGVVGTCCALEAAMRGHRVRLIDPRAPGTGTSFGTSLAIPDRSSENPVPPPGIAGLASSGSAILAPDFARASRFW